MYAEESTCSLLFFFFWTLQFWSSLILRMNTIMKDKVLKRILLLYLPCYLTNLHNKFDITKDSSASICMEDKLLQLSSVF